MRDDFAAFLLVDEVKATSTVEKMLQRLDRARERGLHVERFAESADAVLEEGRRYLRHRREGGPHAYNLDVRLLLALARFYGHPVRFPKMPEPRVPYRALSPDEVAAIVAWEGVDEIASARGRALVLVALKTGWRASEVASMRVEDVDTARHRFFCRKPAKQGMRRWVPAEPWVFSPVRALTRWLRLRPSPSGADADALWTTEEAGRRRACSPDFLRRSFYDIGHDTGVRLNFNRARHTRATELLRRGWDLRYIQFYLGHASISSTQVYAEVHEDDVASLMKRRPGKDYVGG